MIPNCLNAGQVMLRKMGGHFDAARRYTTGKMVSVKTPSLMDALLYFVVALVALFLPDAALPYLPFLFVGATGYSSSATAVTTLADLYEKTNTDVKTATRLANPETKWFRSYPREQITVSGNENRVPLILTPPIMPSFIPDGGSERIMHTPAPTHGTFLPVQANVRYGFTALATALGNRAKAAMIEDQVTYQANMGGYSFGLGIALSTYGTSVGTIAVVKTTGSSSATQVVPLKNAFGASTFVAGGDGDVQDRYLSNLIGAGNHVALIRAAAIVEFGNVTASPSATSGIGYVDVTFTSAITPTVGDLIVFANADGDSTITGTDYNQWPIGWTDILLNDSVLGVTTTSYPKWAPGSTQTATQRFGFSVKERLINDIHNASGVTANRFIISQGVRRDVISGELGGRRYDGSNVDINGDLSAGSGEKYFTSPNAFPNTVIGWFNPAVSQITLSDLPEDGASKGIFKLDKVQGKAQMAAGYDFFFQRIPTSRAATGYATNLTSD